MTLEELKLIEKILRHLYAGSSVYCDRALKIIQREIRLKIMNPVKE